MGHGALIVGYGSRNCLESSICAYDKITNSVYSFNAYLSGWVRLAVGYFKNNATLSQTLT